MNWWAFTSPANSFVRNIASRADAQSEANVTGTTLHGPFATQAEAQAAIGGNQIPPCKGSGAWNYNVISGSLKRVPTVIGIPPIVLGFGWHRLNISYCATRAEAMAEAAREFPNGPVPGGNVAGNLVKGAVQDVTPGGVNSFLGNLTSRDLIVRVVEVVLGGAILLVGVATVFPASKAGKAIVKTAPKLFV